MAVTPTDGAYAQYLEHVARSKRELAEATLAANALSKQEMSKWGAQHTCIAIWSIAIVVVLWYLLSAVGLSSRHNDTFGFVLFCLGLYLFLAFHMWLDLQY